MFGDDYFDIFSGASFGHTERECKKDEEARKAYEKASNVDVLKQKEIWDERAKGYWGEYKVFSILFKELDFPNKMLVNVQIPADNGKTTEIDLILIAPSGIYVFEVKHFSGSVYGGYDSATWTEYYKTRDSITFENPLKQNEYHVSQLKRMFPDVTLYSYVVFSNSDANIKVGGRYPGDLTVTRIEDLQDKIRADFASREEIYSPAVIESFFKTLEKYSPMETNKDEYMTNDQEILPFSGFAEAMLNDLEEAKKTNRKAVEYEYQSRFDELKREKAEVQKLKKQCEESVKAAEKERDEALKSLAEFRKNFEVVTPYQSGYGIINRDCFSAEVEFEKSDSFEHTTNMYFTFHNTSKELWFNAKDAWFIVGKKNGNSQKYIIGEQISSYFLYSHFGPQGITKRMGIRLFNVFEEEIKFIKLCNVLVATNQLSRTNIAPDIEFEIHTAPGVESVYNTSKTCAEERKE